jgi:hypothetical protein
VCDAVSPLPLWPSPKLQLYDWMVPSGSLEGLPLKLQVSAVQVKLN